MAEGGQKGGEDMEMGRASSVTKLLKVYSREAKLMDALIETCVHRKLLQRQDSGGDDVVDSAVGDSAAHRVVYKLDRLCLSDFTTDGEKIDPQ